MFTYIICKDFILYIVLICQWYYALLSNWFLPEFPPSTTFPDSFRTWPSSESAFLSRADRQLHTQIFIFRLSRGATFLSVQCVFFFCQTRFLLSRHIFSLVLSNTFADAIRQSHWGNLQRYIQGTVRTLARRLSIALGGRRRFVPATAFPSLSLLALLVYAPFEDLRVFFILRFIVRVRKDSTFYYNIIKWFIYLFVLVNISFDTCISQDIFLNHENIHDTPTLPQK